MSPQTLYNRFHSHNILDIFNSYRQGTPILLITINEIVMFLLGKNTSYKLRRHAQSQSKILCVLVPKY
ncbi:hypothetical protein H8356DRAFT_1355764 [Neocallimastix lanati (nom. inval.)]|nr:hypothetical protein H8356DRAFT_1355764 [Neocallimastix sp. JGI-2020a]